MPGFGIEILFMANQRGFKELTKGCYGLAELVEE
jgi:hypothetical protein